MEKAVTRISENNIRSVLAVRIPFIPDFLSDNTLISDSKMEKLSELFRRFEQFVIGFRKFHGTAYSLRYISDPQRGEVSVYLLARMFKNMPNYASGVVQLEQDLKAHLQSSGIPFEDVKCESGELFGYHFDNQQSLSVVEIRQREKIVPFMTVKQEAFVIHPYWGPKGAMIEPFEVMLQMDVPTMISITLQPTELSNEEFFSLSEAGFISQTVADLNIHVESTRSISRRRDPGAELVGEIYKEYIKELDEPFLCVTQVLSPDPNSAWTVARSFSASLFSPMEDWRSQQGKLKLPSGSSFFVPQTQEEYQYAMQVHNDLVINDWGQSLASEGKRRLPYLMGAKGVSTCFRFPISMGAGLPGIAVKQLPPDFEPGPRPMVDKANELHLGDFQRGGGDSVRIKDLSRHTLVTGFTGSGKTNTILYLLDQMWKNHRIPFLVIESAKKEYRSLLYGKGWDDLLVFTLGNDICSPFRFNPFELLPGVRLEAHLGKLQACFDAALPQFGILPSIIAESMETIYKKKGWQLTDVGLDNPGKLFPTMRDLFAEVIRVTESRGYSGETYQNIRAATTGRIGSLLQGSRGKMFNTLYSVPAKDLFKRPVILELNDLNEDDKALIMMFLLTLLREYRETNPAQSLTHVTVVEEAHNVFSNVQSSGNSEVSADTKAKAVTTFANMLSEVRSYGEGIMIIDQSPSKLAPDAVRNTNLQIVHQLRDSKDREAMAAAMIMDDNQKTYLAKLPIGKAAVFKTGSEKASFIQVPEYKDTAGFLRPPDDATVHQWMEKFWDEKKVVTVPFSGCKYCPVVCEHREMVEPYTRNSIIHQSLLKAFDGFNANPQPEFWPQNWQNVSQVCLRVAQELNYPNNQDIAYCYLSHELDIPFNEHMRKMFLSAVEGIRGEV